MPAPMPEEGFALVFAKGWEGGLKGEFQRRTLAYTTDEDDGGICHGHGNVRFLVDLVVVLG